MKKIFTLILSLALMQTFGQTPAIVMQVVASSGGYAETTNLKVSWTLGEPVIQTVANTGNTLILTQGFQQGNLFNVDVPNTDLPTLKFKMYPNPTNVKVWFELNSNDAKGDFIVDVYDVAGRKILHENLGEFDNQGVKSMDVSSLKSGIYLVRVNIGNYNSDVMKLLKE